MSGTRGVLTAEQVSAINAPIEMARSLPAVSYQSQEFFDAERERIFSRHWVCVLFDFDVADPGQALPFELCGMPLLAVRDQQGILRVFHNVVPYDGCLAVIEPAMGLNEITTPYHGWVYGLDGKLRAAPFWDGTPQRDQLPNGAPATDLREVHCETYRLSSIAIAYGD
jgi:choline monooxygenase